MKWPGMAVSRIFIHMIIQLIVELNLITVLRIFQKQVVQMTSRLSIIDGAVMVLQINVEFLGQRV